LWVFSQAGGASAQVGLKFSGEAGPFSGDGLGISSRDEYTLRFDARMHYRFEDRKNVWSLRFRIRPKMYGLANSTSITKYSGDAEYWRRTGNVNWGFSFSRHLYRYSFGTSDLNFDILQLQGTTSWSYRPNIGLVFYLKYFYRDFSASLHNSLDAVVTGGKIQWLLSRYSRIVGGVYAESYSIKNDIRGGFQVDQIENSGWRLGPEFAYEFQRKFVFRLSYRFLHYQSESSSDLNNEHAIRILFGKVLNRRWSVFLLLDTYLRNLPASDDTLNYTVYTPLNTENSLYGKIEYSLSKQTSIFFKLEYSKDELFFQDLAFTSRQSTIGVEFKK
jgi:hypothetical protein